MKLGKYHFSSNIRNFISHNSYYILMFFITYTFKGQVHVFAGRVKIVRENCKSLVLQDKRNFEIFLSPVCKSSVLQSNFKSYMTHLFS